MLCKTCKTMFAMISTERWHMENGVPARKIPHHKSVESFQASAAQGCYICCLYLRDAKPYDGDYTVEIFDFHKKDKEYHCKLVNRSVESTPSEPASVRFRLQEATELTAELAAKSLAKTFTGSRAGVELIKHWLSTCETQHKACNKTTVPTWYPSRLLDVCGSNIRLVSTESEKISARYATLSHCWGKTPFESLSTENMHSLQEGLPLSWFPLTFRDAILLVRRLELRYLWIDCFCILQTGDAEEVSRDKQREISRMKSVYANSHLNIGATYSWDPFGGCFVERHQESNPAGWPCLRETYIADMEHVWCDLGLGKGLTYYQIIDDFDRSELQEDLYMSQLFRRAWVLQERMLCPRMLHCGKSQIHWECSEYGSVSEGFPHGPGPSEHVGRPPFTMTQDRRVFGRYPLVSKDWWWTITVQAYSKLILSRPEEDKLIALGGMAERAAQLLGDEYIAGLFKNTVISDLCFKCDGSSQEMGSNNLPGPSWSWASKRCAVKFMPAFRSHARLRRTHMATYHSHKVQLLNSDIPFGAVTSASLTLAGRVIDTKVTGVGLFGDSVYAVHEDSQHKIELTFDERKRFSKKTKPAKGSMFSILLLCWSTIEGLDEQNLDAIKAATFQNDGTGLYGLVLKEQQDGTYRRVGGFHRNLEYVCSDRRLLEIWEMQKQTLVTLV